MHESKDRTNRIVITVTDEEKNAIIEKAVAERKTMSRYCRDLALGKTKKKED